MKTVTFTNGSEETNEDQFIYVTDYGVRIVDGGQVWHHPWHQIRYVYERVTTNGNLSQDSDAS